MDSTPKRIEREKTSCDRQEQQDDEGHEDRSWTFRFCSMCMLVLLSCVRSHFLLCLFSSRPTFRFVSFFSRARLFGAYKKHTHTHSNSNNISSPRENRAHPSIGNILKLMWETRRFHFRFLNRRNYVTVNSRLLVYLIFPSSIKRNDFRCCSSSHWCARFLLTQYGCHNGKRREGEGRGRRRRQRW